MWLCLVSHPLRTAVVNLIKSVPCLLSSFPCQIDADCSILFFTRINLLNIFFPTSSGRLEIGLLSARRFATIRLSVKASSHFKLIPFYLRR